MKVFVALLVIVSSALSACMMHGCQKNVPKVSAHSFGDWKGELAYMICADLTRQHWLTGKVHYGEWKNPLAPSVLEAMKAPAITSITVNPKGTEPYTWSGVTATDVIITFNVGGEDYAVDTDFQMLVRGKNWIPVQDTDWSTGKNKLFEARDNYIYAIAYSGRFPSDKSTFTPVGIMQVKDVPEDAYKDLTYRWEKEVLVIRDLREKKQYRFKRSSKKGDPYGTVQVSPMK